jgi:hypothetical protein
MGLEKGAVDVTFALPHWLFWAAMCLRELDDAAGLARILAVLTAVRPLGNNLVLQTAAVAGGVAYLRAVEPLGIVKPGNLALALMEAGLTAEFDAPPARSPGTDLRTRRNATRGRSPGVEISMPRSPSPPRSTAISRNRRARSFASRTLHWRRGMVPPCGASPKRHPGCIPG